MSSEIAFKPEDATIPRHLRRQMEKRGDRIYKFLCMKCKHEEYGGATYFEMFRKDEKTGKEYPVRIHRQCPKCGENMIKINEG